MDDIKLEQKIDGSWEEVITPAVIRRPFDVSDAKDEVERETDAIKQLNSLKSEFQTRIDNLDVQITVKQNRISEITNKLRLSVGETPIDVEPVIVHG